MKEREIRPEALVRRYIELSARDAERIFAGQPRTPIPCPGCGRHDSAQQFVKSGFAYARCAHCGTLFQSPRPPIAAFESFYRHSESSRYWAEVFFPAVAEVRREKIFRPRVERLSAICAERGFKVEKLIEVGAGYGIFLDEWRRRDPTTQLVGIEPSRSLAHECRSKGFTIVEDIVENTKGYDGWADLVICFEVLEHAYETVEFIKVLAKLVRPGGYVFVSTLSIDGFDLQVLWDKSTQISPPHHINFLSVYGFQRLFERAGLTEISVTTPGQLDVDIVRNAARMDPAILEGRRFLKTLLGRENTAAVFQNFLAANRLSSHAWVLGRRP